MKIVVIGHHGIREPAEALARSFDAYLLMEGDAQPVAGFRGLEQSWLERFPEHLCSFYLGTGCPPEYQCR